MGPCAGVEFHSNLVWLQIWRNLCGAPLGLCATVSLTGVLLALGLVAIAGQL